MKRDRAASLQRRNGEHGQVLILAVVALILVIIAILLLFDVQTVIRGKIKAQNGVDAAALTGAEWQKHSLNLIGELNLVRATGTLISDPFFERAVLETYRKADEFFFPEGAPIRNHTNDFLKFPELEEIVIRDQNNEVVGLKGGLLFREVFRVEREMFYLDTLDRIVSQLQTRIAFVGPLIGFGAAQQAAKNNGITFDNEASEFYIKYLNLVGNNGIYEHVTPEHVNDYGWRSPYVSMLNSILDYSAFHNDFTGETENRAYGIAAGTKFKFVGMPSLTTNPPSDLSNYLGDKHFYDMIHARDWCGLDRLLRLDFNGNWWGEFECEFDEDFSGQSEILPLHITFSYHSPEDSNERSPYSKPASAFRDAADYMERYANGRGLLTRTFQDETNPYMHGHRHQYEPLPSSEGKRDIEVTINTSPFDPFPGTRSDDSDDESVVDRINTWDIIIPGNDSSFSPEEIRLFINTFLDTYNDEDSDLRYDPLPILSWAVFDEDWSSYGDDKKEWDGYLRGRLKPGMDYKSGALSYFEAEQDTVTVSGSMGRPRRGSRAPDVGQVFASAQTNGEAQRVSNALYRLNNTNSVNRIETNAEAKPIGRIKTEDGQFLRPFEAGRMILPVFTETALIPIALEPVEGMSMSDIDWLYYLTEFVPLLSGSPSLQDAWKRAMELYPAHLGYFSKYVSALAVLSDPDFRRAGLDWLDATAVWAKDKDGNRYPLYTNREYNCTGRRGGNGPGGGWQGTNFSNGGPSSLH